MRLRSLSLLGGALFSVCLELCAQTFTNVTGTAGILAPPFSGFGGFGRGAAWEDYDLDGDLDCFMAGGPGQPIQVFWNNGLGAFTAQPIPPFLGGNREDHQCVAGDFDNDGDSDVYVCQGNYQPNLLFVNNGSGGFTEQAGLRGVAWAGASYGASWGDFDRDGWLDLYVGDLYSVPPLTVAPPHQLFRGSAQGTFTNVTAASNAASPGNALAVLWHDYDNDMWPDLHIGNDRGNFGQPPNALLRNNRNGTFVDVAPTVHANAPIGCMGITVGDIHNDGGQDVFLTNVQTGHVLLLWNPLLQNYVYPFNWFTIANTYGLNTVQIGWGCNFFDYDNDGWLDLFVAHSQGWCRLFKGTGAAPFLDHTVLRGIDVICPPTSSSCQVDYDDDGDLDIFTPGLYTGSQLLQNPGFGGNWLTIRLRGTLSNRDGQGTLVKCKSASGTRQRRRTSGEGFLCDPDPRLHFGVGTDGIVNELELRWPSGTVHFVTNVAVNQHHTITEPMFSLTGSMTPGSSTTLGVTLPSDAGLVYFDALVANAAGEHYLSDGRAVRINVNDPLLAVSTTLGNPLLGFFTGIVAPNGSFSSQLHLPPIPALTGFALYVIGITLDPTRPSGVKSIIGPQRLVIN